MLPFVNFVSDDTIKEERVEVFWFVDIVINETLREWWTCFVEEFQPMWTLPLKVGFTGERPGKLLQRP
jgi:hypothetical protein